jgi:predicted PurR-regulated permease PerM
MLFFYWLWGVVGFVLAIPLTALVKIALECSEDGRRFAALLAAEHGQGASKTK